MLHGIIMIRNIESREWIRKKDMEYPSVENIQFSTINFEAWCHVEKNFFKNLRNL